jgi:tight adherence protein C
MTRAFALQAGVALVLLSLGAAVAMLPRLQRGSRIGERIRGSQGGAAAAVAPPTGRRLAGLLQRLGQALLNSGLLGATTLAQMRQTVSGAGFRGPHALAAFVGTKALLTCGLPIACWPLTVHAPPMLAYLLLAGAAVAGLVAPDTLLRRIRDRHCAAVERGLADALDLMVICAEAGLALEAAVERVALEMRETNRAIAAEFSTTANELRVLPDRREALLNMGTRTALQPLQRLGGTLAQTLRYGSPLTQALRVLAAELRHETLMRFEARAARLPVILTLPTILFILPCIFLIVGGPAMLRVMDVFAQP